MRSPTNLRAPFVSAVLLALVAASAVAQRSEPDDVLYGYVGSGADAVLARYEFRWRRGPLEIAFAPYGRAPAPLREVRMTADRTRLSFRWSDGASCELQGFPEKGSSYQGLVDVRWVGRCSPKNGEGWDISVGLENGPDFGQNMPASVVDLRIIDRATQLLANADAWNRNDDRVCEDDDENRRWSLFCALYRASLDEAGEYLHARRAMDSVRLAIRESTGLRYVHTLRDYNNHPDTTFGEIRERLRDGRVKVETEVSNPFR